MRLKRGWHLTEHLGWATFPPVVAVEELPGPDDRSRLLRLDLGDAGVVTSSWYLHPDGHWGLRQTKFPKRPRRSAPVAAEAKGDGG